MVDNMTRPRLSLLVLRATNPLALSRFYGARALVNCRDKVMRPPHETAWGMMAMVRVPTPRGQLLVLKQAAAS